MIKVIKMSLAMDLSRKGFTIIDGVIPQKICDSLRNQIDSILDSYEDKIDRTIFSTKSNAQARNRYFYDSGDKISFFWEEGAFDGDGNLIYPKVGLLIKLVIVFIVMTLSFVNLLKVLWLKKLFKRVLFLNNH